MLDRKFTRAGYGHDAAPDRHPRASHRLQACTTRECDARLGRGRPRLRANFRSSILTFRQSDVDRVLELQRAALRPDGIDADAGFAASRSYGPRKSASISSGSSAFGASGA